MPDSGHPAAGAWADLIGLDEADRVLFIGTDRGGGALDRLRSRAGEVTVISAERFSEVSGRTFDLVIGEHLQFEVAERVAALFSYAGSVVFVADNRVSPLVGAPFRTPGWTPWQLSRLESQLQEQAHVFALLRSADLPTTSFRLDIPKMASIVLGGAAVGAGRGRRRAIRSLAVLAERNLAKYVVPAWLVVRSDRGDEPTGRMAVAENDQGVVLFGEGPDSVEKTYSTTEEVETVCRAMASLDAAGLDIGGRVLSQPSGLRLRLAWVAGNVLDANALPPAELAIWTERASEALGRIHSGTLDDDGTVLVHGDFWLGAVVAADDSISGIIDWTDSHRGSPEEDLESLVAVARSRSELTAAERETVMSAARRGYRRGGGQPAI